MSERVQSNITQHAPTSFTPASQGVLQRQCACGNHTMGGGQCAECAKNNSGLQRKLAIGASNDPLEQEADRVAGQVMAAPAHSPVSVAPPRIQRFSGSSNGQIDEAPASVDQALASLGRPLEPTLRQDMEQRFGHDFSRVRVHSDVAAEQSAQDVNAQAYTVGRDLVFAGGQYEPDTAGGRRLLAHELAHVVQQSGFGNPSKEPFVQRACLPESECATPKEKPRAGSAKQFGKEMERQEAPKRAEKRQQTPEMAQAGGHGRRAVEVEKLFQEHLPNLRQLIHSVFVDDTLPSDAVAGLVNCLKWAEEALPQGADKTAFEGADRSCIRIPKQLENEAALYNRRSPNLTAELRDELRLWLNWKVVRVLTHEVTHERFNETNITFPSNQKNCTKETLALELSELAAVISEFPIVEGLTSDMREAWANDRLIDPRQKKDPGEGIFGPILDIRCSCECGDADALIRAAFTLASSSWTADEKKEFHAYMKRGKGKELGAYWPYEASRVGRVGSHDLSLTGGVAFSGSKKLSVAMLTYHYVLWNWAEGRLRLTGGAQVNLARLWESDPRGELGAATVGLQYVSTPVSREKRFGGLTGRLDTGFGLGEFSLKPAGPDTAKTPDWILQVSGGVQFFIPRLTDMTPISLEAAYRLAQPLDTNAKNIQTVSVSASIQF